jgi:hypothetical protein
MPFPVRRHKKRRNQSDRYHERIQKKWNKRFGTKLERFAIIFDPIAVGLLGGRQIALHPEHYALLRNIAL